MFCTKCGTELNAQGKCPKCDDATTILDAEKEQPAVDSSANGTQVLNYNPPKQSQESAPVKESSAAPVTAPVTPAPMKKKKKKGKKILILFIVFFLLFALLAIGGAVAIIFHMYKPINRFSEEIKQGNVETAMEYLEKIDKDDPNELAKAKELALESAEKIKVDFFNETTDYATTTKLLNKLEADLLAGNSELEKIRSFVDRINESRAIYSAAVKLQESNKLEEAIEEYSKVDLEDSYYELAQSAIVDCEKMYLENVMAQVKVYQDEQCYEEAIQLIDKALLVLENEGTLIAERRVCMSSYEEKAVNAVIQQAKEMVEKTDDIEAYKKACQLIDPYILEFPDNNELSTLRNEYAEEYCSLQLQNADALVKASQTESAIIILQSIIELCPDRTDVAQLITEYQAYLPISLYDLAVYEENVDSDTGFTDHVSTQDTYENPHKDAVRIELYDGRYSDARKAERVYLVNSKYNHFHATISYELCDRTKGGGRLFVVADGETIYDSGNITDTTRPVEVDVDFENIQFVTLVFQSLEFSSNTQTNLLMDEACFSYVPK